MSCKEELLTSKVRVVKGDGQLVMRKLVLLIRLVDSSKLLESGKSRFC